MGILKKIDTKFEQAGKNYRKAKEDTKNIRKTGSKIFNLIIPPKKKLQSAKAKPKERSRTTVIKKGNITCTCKSK